MSAQGNAVLSLISILILWVGLFWLYRDFRTDSFRQNLFALRDRLFDDAAEGRLPFDSAAYSLIRTTMNGMIRFAHQLTIIHFVIIVFRKGPIVAGGKDFKQIFDDALAGLSKEQQELCVAYIRRLDVMLVKHLILSSPLLVGAVLVPVIGYAAMKRAMQKVASVFEEEFRRVDKFAYIIGRAEA